MNHPEQYNRLVLVKVDPQVDFCPGGTLAVDRGDEVIPRLNEAARWTRLNNGLVVQTRDWHPAETAHFDVNGGPWPVHCVEGTPGAAFHPDLEIEPTDITLSKGTDLIDDGFSGFEGRGEDGVTLEALITPRTPTERVAVVAGGLATDYCVKATVIDGCKLADRLKLPDFQQRVGIFVLNDAIRAVNLNPGDGERAIGDMQVHGARFVNTQDLVNGNVITVG